jgi:hypothetical protein
VAPELRAQPAPAPSVAVFDAHAAGVDPRAASYVADQLRSTAGALGWSIVPVERLRSLPAQGALTPARAAELTRASGATHGIFANVSAEGGRYVVSLSIVPADGTAAKFAKGEAVHGELGPASDRLLRSVLSAPPAAPPPAPPPAPVTPVPVAAPPPAQPAFEQSFRFAIQTEAAFGVATGSFYNHLAGARLDRRFSEEFSLGAYLAYANLKGKEGRAHNVLPAFLLEYRAALSDDWALPFRFAPGYLPKNGPTLRLSAGISFEAADGVELVLEPLTPMVWLTGDQAVLSLNVAAEVAFAL